MTKHTQPRGRGRKDAAPPSPPTTTPASSEAPAGTRRLIAEGRHLRMLEEQGWEMVERVRVSGIVILVALTSERHIVLVEQFRRPVGANVMELPAGLAGDIPGSEHEALLVAAKRELLEETGYESDDWLELTAGPVSPGLSSEVVTFFLAKNARRVGPGGGDEHEAIEVHTVPLATIEPWLDAQRQRGCLVDPKLYAGLYFAAKGL